MWRLYYHTRDDLKGKLANAKCKYHRWYKQVVQADDPVSDVEFAIVVVTATAMTTLATLVLLRVF